MVWNSNLKLLYFLLTGLIFLLAYTITITFPSIFDIRWQAKETYDTASYFWIHVAQYIFVTLCGLNSKLPPEKVTLRGLYFKLHLANHIKTIFIA